MKLLEYEGKQILADAGIAIPKYTLINANSQVNISVPVVLKSQVPTGRRSKAGGILIVKDKNKVSTNIEKLFNLPIKGHLPKAILADEFLDIKSEYYISVLIDKKSAAIELVAHINGGIDVEANDHDSFLRLQIGASNIDVVSKQLAEHFGLLGHTRELKELLTKLYNCLIDNDATIVEVNPLVLTNSNCFVAADCKIELDDSASFRHPNWDFVHGKYSNNFVILDGGGKVATIANGAGLAMATVDAVADAGLKPANFLDVGGGADNGMVLEAFKKIMGFKNVQAIIINIFAGITHCDEVAKAIVAAKQEIDNLPPLFIRLAGTNSDEAKAILQENNIPFMPSLQDCINNAKTEVNNG